MTSFAIGFDNTPLAIVSFVIYPLKRDSIEWGNLSLKKGVVC